MISVLLKVAWTTLIYHVWRERNHRIFSQKEETMEQVMNRIREAIRFRLDKLQNVKADHINTTLYRARNLSVSIFA